MDKINGWCTIPKLLSNVTAKRARLALTEEVLIRSTSVALEPFYVLPEAVLGAKSDRFLMLDNMRNVLTLLLGIGTILAV